MTLDLGDEAIADAAITIDVPSNTAGSAGDFVTWDAGNDRVDATDAANESIFGVLAEDAPGTAGDTVPVHIHGPVVANLGGSVVQGDVLVTSSTEGQAAASGGVNARTITIDEGGTTNHGEFAPTHPYALSDSGGSWPYNGGNSLGANEGVVMIP